MITLKNLTKHFPTPNGSFTALKNINLQINQGEIFGIIGKSGAGKSTLIRCINMLERPSAGTVEVDGQNLTTMSESQLRQARKQIGMIFQHFNLLTSRTVYGNVAFPLELAGRSKQEIQATVPRLLELVGLTDKQQQYPSQLSGGQKQRVGIARALASQPKVLLCDEATSALDPQTTNSILDLLQDINRRLQLTIVLITHEMHVIKKICDRVAVIEAGSIIEEGPILDIFASPKSTTTKDFIASITSQDLPGLLAEAHYSPTSLPESNLILRLSFIGHSAESPILAGMIRKFNIDTSILYGNIDYIQNTPFGTLVVELSGEQHNIEQALLYLQAQNLGIEVIGYVARNARAIG